MKKAITIKLLTQIKRNYWKYCLKPWVKSCNSNLYCIKKIRKAKPLMLHKLPVMYLVTSSISYCNSLIRLLEKLQYIKNSVLSYFK